MSRPNDEGLNPFGLTAKEARMIADHVEEKETEKEAEYQAFRRERIASKIMAGLMANSAEHVVQMAYDNAANVAVDAAEALIKRLDSWTTK